MSQPLTPTTHHIIVSSGANDSRHSCITGTETALIANNDNNNNSTMLPNSNTLGALVNKRARTVRGNLTIPDLNGPIQHNDATYWMEKDGINTHLTTIEEHMLRFSHVNSSPYITLQTLDTIASSNQ